MELILTLRTTAAIRAFTDEPVSDATVYAILDDARFAPSGGNRQPWRVAVVRDPAVRGRLGDLMRPVWHDYVARAALGVTPYNSVDDRTPERVVPVPLPLLDDIADAPVVLAVAADLRRIALMDTGLERPPLTGGASVYPFCWSILLSARAHGLGGVMTTFLSRAEPAAARALGLPEHHALAATIFLGMPERHVTRLRREPVESFATVDRYDGRPLTAS